MADAGARRARAKPARARPSRPRPRPRRAGEALDRPGAPPAGDLFLVVGTGLDTPAGLVLDPQSRRPVRVTMEEGDGVVLRASALGEEGQGGHPAPGRRPSAGYRTVLLLPGEHVGITQDPVFADNLLYWLLGSPRS